MTLRALVPFFVALVGVALLFWSFVAGINAALNAGGSGSLFWQVVFVLAGLAVVGTIVISIINLVKKRAIVISVATLFVAIVPLVMIVILAVSAASAVSR